MIVENPTTGIAMPTDADWGRLYKFNTIGDSGLVMPPRSYYFRDFIPGAWTDMAIGFIFATCGNTGDLSTLNDERLASSTPANLFHFGLSKSSGSTINVGTNPNFLGLRGQIGSTPQILSASKLLTRNILTCVNYGGTQLGSSAYDFNLTEGVTATPFNMIGLRCIYDPTTNLVCVNRAVSNGITLADDAANITTLTTFLEGISNDVTFPNARFSIYNITNFTTFYIFWPYLLNRLKLHCVGAIKLG